MKAAVLPTFQSVKIAKKEMNFLVSFVLKKGSRHKTPNC